MKRTAALTLSALLALASAAVQAKLPPPSDEAKAKAAEAAAKAAYASKVANFQLCKSMDQVAADCLAAAKKAGKAASAPLPTPSCADPGPFVYSPPEAKPIEAAGAHSPTTTAAAPPSGAAPTAAPTPKK